MILIGVAWLLVIAIAYYQSRHGLFSAVIMSLLTTICAVFALGSYEWLAVKLYADLPAFADASSLTACFVLPLLALRLTFDKVITGNAPLDVWPDRIAGGVLGFYLGTVMVGVLIIIVQMLPLGTDIIGYKPYDNALQRADRIYCDEFALGLLNVAGGLSSGRDISENHDDLLRELFCARNTAGLNGRVDTPPKALSIPNAYTPGKAWAKVIDHDTLPEKPALTSEVGEGVLIVKTLVSDKVRSDKKGDMLYRLPATHYRLVTGAGKSYYPLGYIIEEEGRWKLYPAAVTEEETQITDLHVLREYNAKIPNEMVLWVYRLPQPLPEDSDLSDAEGAEDEDAAKAALEEK